MRMKLLSLSLLAFHVAVLLSPKDSTAEKIKYRLSDVAKPLQRPLGAPELDDICFSSRWARPIDSEDPHDTFKAAKLFHATRIDWSYSNDVAFIREVKNAGLVYFGTISGEMDGLVLCHILILG